jgi:predicted deacylase
MRQILHTLQTDTPGTQRSLVSWHFGQAGGKKAYLQASLHADEPPGMLVLHHLKSLLLRAEADHLIKGEIVLVPLANPIGLSQYLLRQGLGRFEMNSAENFNRNYPDLVAMLDEGLFEQLGDDPEENCALIRAHLTRALNAIQPKTELESLRLTLMRLAFDSDIVLDLHCDNEAVMHLYTETPYWRHAEPLARYLGARVTLLAEGSGSAAGGAFDEAQSGLWWRVPRLRAAARKPVPALPLATFAVTIEYRGTADVSHAQAKHDAACLFDYLCHEGLIDGVPPPLPALLGEPTPLAGSMPIYAPHGGVLTFHREVGDQVLAGEPIADIVDVLSGTVTTLSSPVAGCLYARMSIRMVRAFESVARVAGEKALREGSLLTA